jgi:quinol monooxygenase YgiN
MSVTRLNHFRAHEGREGALRESLLSILPSIRGAAGSISCRLLRDVEEPTRFVVVEVWESVEAHRASLADFKPEDFAEVMKLFAAPPSGSYFTASPG